MQLEQERRKSKQALQREKEEHFNVQQQVRHLMCIPSRPFEVPFHD